MSVPLSADLLTDDERRFAALHVVQRMIGAQAAARAYPDQFRLLGCRIVLP